jgi:threonine dehydrogenase-like Zn-dependent dehydrogenase
MAQTMRAVVFKEPGVIVVEDRLQPKIEKPTDAILKVRMAALCGRSVIDFSVMRRITTE